MEEFINYSIFLNTKIIISLLNFKTCDIIQKNWKIKDVNRSKNLYKKGKNYVF